MSLGCVVFGGFCVFVYCMLVVILELDPSLRTCFCQFWVLLILGCDRARHFSDFIMFPLPLNPFIVLGICSLDFGGSIVFASRSEVSV